jgi:mono/diheme cytochrome c family protein
VVLLRRFGLIAFSASAFWAPALQSQSPSFETGLYRVMEKANCRACHNADGVASGTRLHLPESDAPPAKIEAFGRSLVSLVDRERPEASLLLKKPTARMPHAGGERIKPGSEEETVLNAWIVRLAGLSGEELTTALHYREQEDKGAGAAVQDAEIRRLTHSQFNHTVRDLLGDQTTPANQFPPEDFVNGFRNQSRGQSLSPLLIEAYSAAAERLARSAFQGGDTHGLIPCKASAACRSRFVREFGLKTFRRPLDAGEQKRYETLMARETDLVKGAQLVVEAMLQSPNFLFRLDATPDARLKPWATANRLSYSLWDTMPDAELFAAAARGNLSTRAGVEKATRRMLADPRARESLNEFVSQWLRFDRLLTASKDRRKFPLYTRETAMAMTEEARTFFSDLVWNKGNFMTLFTADYGYVSPELATIYAVPAPAKDFDRVPFPAGSERAGLLGQGLFLALTAKPEESSPTARGLFVREQFLCQHVPDPPPGVNTNLPAVTEAKPQTNRDRMSEHATNPSCATCHKLIDPIGFGLEKFDAVGARRDQFALQFQSGRKPGGGRGMAAKTVNLTIDTAGNVAGIPDSQFSSPAELGAVLAKSTQCQECVVKQYFRYTAGRLETPADRPLILKAVEEFRKSQFQFQELMVSLTLLREFSGRNILEEGTNHVASNH